AEEGERSRLESACVLGNPWDLIKNNWALEHTFIGKQVYSKGMANNLVNVLKLHSKALEKVDPPTPSPTSKYEPDSTQASLVCAAYHAAVALRSPPLSVFDTTFTRVGGGGPPVRAHHVVPHVRKPLVAINSTDDPVVHAPTSPEESAQDTPSSSSPKAGGTSAVAFEEMDDKVRRWMTKPALEWLRLAAEVLVHGHPELPPREVVVDENGWIREVNGVREGLGCRTVESGDLIDGTEVKKEPGMLQGL
ncbi:hypothetical protein F5880DRAFT_1653170, partial [Lentinula raphanica]